MFKNPLDIKSEIFTYVNVYKPESTERFLYKEVLKSYIFNLHANLPKTRTSYETYFCKKLESKLEKKSKLETPSTFINKLQTILLFIDKYEAGEI